MRPCQIKPGLPDDSTSDNDIFMTRTGKRGALPGRSRHGAPPRAGVALAGGRAQPAPARRGRDLRRREAPLAHAGGRTVRQRRQGGRTRRGERQCATVDDLHPSRCLANRPGILGSIEDRADDLHPREPRDAADDMVQLHVHDHQRAEYTIDRHVWFDAGADLVAPLAHGLRIVLARRAARRIHAACRWLTIADGPSKSFHEVTTLNGRARSTRRRPRRTGRVRGSASLPRLPTVRILFVLQVSVSMSTPPRGTRSWRSFR
jgi:hypothetical protein